MSSIWIAISRKIRSVLLVACPFCATDYGPTEEEEDTPPREVYEPKKRNVREKDKKKDDIIVDDEAGFSSKSGTSNSQCPDMEVENSDEVNRVLLRKSQFLPPEPYVPTQQELENEKDSLKKATLLKPHTMDRKQTLKFGTIDRKQTLKDVKKEEKDEKRKTFTFKRDKKDKTRAQSVSPAKSASPLFDDNISQTSKKSKKSVFSFRKRKKGNKKDGDSVSLFSFASFKSNKSASSMSETKEKKERKKRQKQERKDKKKVEKQKLNLSPDLNQQKFENIYPWMNEIEPLDDEVPNLMEEIRIREAQQIYNVQQAHQTFDTPQYVDTKSYAAESFLDLGTQMISELEEPPLAPQQPKFGMPEGEVKQPFKTTPLIETPEPITNKNIPANKSPIPAKSDVKVSLISSDPETEGIVRKNRLPRKDANSEAATVTQDRPVFKKKDIFANVISPKKLRALSTKPQSPSNDIQHGTELQQRKDTSPGTSTPPKDNKSPLLSPRIPPSTSPNPKESFSSSEERDLKKEIQEITEREEFHVLSDRSQGDFKRRKEKDKKKKRKDKNKDRSERSQSKKYKSPQRIESERIDDRSIDDIPLIVEKNLAADLTNPNLFPDSPEPHKDPIPIVNYTRHWEANPKDDVDKVDSIKEIQSTIDRDVSEPKSVNEVKQKVKHNKADARMVVDESLRRQSVDSSNFIEGINMLSDNSHRSQNKSRKKHRSRSASKHDLRDEDSNREPRRKRSKQEKEERRGIRSAETDEERSERRARNKHKRKKRTYSESDLYKPNIMDSPESNVIKWVSPAEKIAEKKRKKRKSKDENRRLGNISDLRRPSKVDIGSPDSNTFSRDIPLLPERAAPTGRSSPRRLSPEIPSPQRPSPGRSSPKQPSPGKSSPNRPSSGKSSSVSPRNKSPKQPNNYVENRGKLQPFPKHIARDINDGDRRRQDLQMEALRQKMDLDFQSVDTKRSIFIMDNNNARNAPSPSYSGSKLKKKNKKAEKINLPPKRRVSSRPNLDPVVSQEEAKIAPRRRVTVISEDESGSTLHSGDEKPVLVRRQSSFESNDSTLHDIDDIPSMWNASVRSRQFSRKSADSADSRITHRSQLSARSNRMITPEVKRKDKKKKKKK